MQPQEQFPYTIKYKYIVYGLGFNLLQITERLAEWLYSTRMYSTFCEMWKNWLKNWLVG